MKVAYCILLFSLALLTGCETLITELDPAKLPSVSSKLVVNSYVSPQSARIIVVVTESVPVYGESSGENKIIHDAVVTLSNGTQEIVLPYDSVGHVYSIRQTSFPIRPGVTYKLTVSDRTRTVTGTCTVPVDIPEIESYRLDTIYAPEYTGRDTAMTLRVLWKDLAGQSNYYRVRGNMEVEYSIPEDANAGNYNERRVRNRFNFDWDDNSGRNQYQNDVNIDGTTFTSPLGKSYFPSSILYYADGKQHYAKQKMKLISATIEVLNTEKSYYDFHRSLILSRNSDNPFAEPSLVFSNIEGGLGCFAAYNTRQIVYRP